MNPSVQELMSLFGAFGSSPQKREQPKPFFDIESALASLRPEQPVVPAFDVSNLGQGFEGTLQREDDRLSLVGSIPGYPELGKDVRKSAMNEALMQAGAALLSGAGTGKYATSLGLAMKQGMDAYKGEIEKRQKLMDEQEQRVRGREQFGIAKAKAGQELQTGELDIKAKKRAESDVESGRKAIDAVDLTKGVWTNPDVTDLGLHTKFEEARAAGDYATAAKVESLAYAAVGEDKKSKDSFEMFRKEKEIEQNGAREIAGIHASTSRDVAEINARGRGSEVKTAKFVVDLVRKRANDLKSAWEAANPRGSSSLGKKVEQPNFLAQSVAEFEAKQPGMVAQAFELVGEDMGLSEEGVDDGVKIPGPISNTLSRYDVQMTPAMKKELLATYAKTGSWEEVNKQVIAYYESKK